MYKALGLLSILRFCLWIPPVDKIAFFVKLAARVIEAVYDLVTHYIAYGTVVHVLWAIIAEETSLQDTSWDYYKTKNRKTCWVFHLHDQNNRILCTLVAIELPLELYPELQELIILYRSSSDRRVNDADAIADTH